MNILNRTQSIQINTESSEKWISSIRRIALDQEKDEFNLLSESCNVNITEQNRQLQRKHISIQLSRGQKLSTKLIKELGLDILFSLKI